MTVRSRTKVKLGAITAAWAVSWLAGSSAMTANACDNLTVRDAAFQEPRDIHRLCLMAASDDSLADDIYAGLQHWLASDGDKLNIELHRADIDDAELNWSEYGIPSAPPSSPAVVLAGHHAADRRIFFVDVWEPSPDSNELELIQTSPARKAIRHAVLRRIAVLLYVPAGDAPDPKTAKTLADTVEAWSDRNPLGLSIVRVDRTDPKERLLLSFIGVKPDSPDWVGVVFGPGKLMAPLVGNDITEAALNDQITSLTAPCTCLQTPSRLGVDLPMAWDDSFNAALVALAPQLAADESPADAAAMSPDGALLPFADPLASTTRSALLLPSLLVVGLLLIASIIATVALFWRRNKRTPSPMEG